MTATTRPEADRAEVDDPLFDADRAAADYADLVELLDADPDDVAEAAWERARGPGADSEDYYIAMRASRRAVEVDEIAVRAAAHKEGR